MIDYAKWHATAPYSLDRRDKSVALTEALLELTSHHAERCPSYRRMLDAVGFRAAAVTSCADLPFLPVRLFKELDLRSVSPDEITKTMTSSGTTGQAVSRIYLDKSTSANQMIDSPAVVKDRNMFSARGAGILGFSIFARERIFALDDEMQLDVEGVATFLEKHAGQTVLLFGFTFMVWQHLYKELARTGRTLDLSAAVLVHGGGWKKLASEAVSSPVFRQRLREVSGLERIHDYYGMVEQTGSIYLECAEGRLHASIYSDVITRRTADFQPAEVGEAGIIEVVSILPASYPGHALLTEDEGIILGEDDCPCGRYGKYFQVLGRIKDAELRGCSDTYAADLSPGRSQ
jgi:phenylacetate-coenzyme A ligase PaaK-like adenylate-forming protein